MNEKWTGKLTNEQLKNWKQRMSSEMAKGCPRSCLYTSDLVGGFCGVIVALAAGIKPHVPGECPQFPTEAESK